MKTGTRLWKAEARVGKERQKLGNILGSMANYEGDKEAGQHFQRMRDIRELAGVLHCMLITLAQDVSRHNRLKTTERTVDK